MGWKAVKDHYGLEGLIVHCAKGTMFLSRLADNLPDPIACLTTGSLLVSDMWTHQESMTQRLVFAKDPELFASLVTREDVFTEPLVTLFAVEGEVVHRRQAVATPEGLVLLDGTLIDPFRHFHSLSDAERQVAYAAECAYWELSEAAGHAARHAAELQKQADEAQSKALSLASARAKRELRALGWAMRGGKGPTSPWPEATAAQRRGILGRAVLMQGASHKALAMPADKVGWQLADYLSMPGAIEPAGALEDPLDFEWAPTAQRLALVQRAVAAEEHIPVTWVRWLMVEYGYLARAAHELAESNAKARLETA